MFVASASTPWRNFVGPDGQLYVADFTDSNGNVYVMPPKSRQLRLPRLMESAVHPPYPRLRSTAAQRRYTLKVRLRVEIWCCTRSTRI